MADLWVVVCCFVVIVMPIWLFLHYGTRWRQSRILSHDHERDLRELSELAERMQGRIETLERLLDATQPEWRKRA